MRRVLALAAAIATSIMWVPTARAGTIDSNVADGILTVNGTTAATPSRSRATAIGRSAMPERGWCQADEVTTLGSIEIAAVTGGEGANLISGGSFTGSLRLKGRGAGDLRQAGAGNDRILGGDGNDFVQAGAGDDPLEGGGGDDSLSGESGNDELSGGRGDDTCRGGPGADSFVSC